MVHGGVIKESDTTSVTKQQQHCHSNPVRDHIFLGKIYGAVALNCETSGS